MTHNSNSLSMKAMQSTIFRLEKSKELTEMFLERIPSAFFAINRNGIILKTNKNGAKMIAENIEQAIGTPLSTIFSDRHWSLMLNTFEDNNRARRSSYVLPITQKTDGTHKLLCWEIDFFDSHNHSNNIILIYGQDVTEQKELQAKMNQIFIHAPIGIFSIDRNRVITDVLSLHMRLLFKGMTFETKNIDQIIAPNEEHKHVNEIAVKKFETFFNKCLTNTSNKKLDIEITYFPNLFLNKEHNHYQFTFFPIYEHNSFIKIVGLVQNLTAFHNEQKARIEMEKMATTDPLTKASNRAGLHQFLQEIFQHKARGALSAIFIDIDYFKKYNDQYGHQKGDDCLVLVANTLKSTLPDGSLLSRYGGEEFLAILPNTHLQDAQDIAEKMRSSIESIGITYAVKPNDSVVTISIGVATDPPISDQTTENDDQLSENGKSPCELILQELPLIKRADKALYFAKNNGRNRIVVLDNHDNET